MISRIAGSTMVYPRVCGGARKCLTKVACVSGLSPRVRGSRLPIRTVCRLRRSIPACAGEPSAHPDSVSAAKVYPRVCGGARYGGPDRC